MSISTLPAPTLCFTLPSIHDNTVLDCRIYHPACLSPSKVSDLSSPWKKKAAILAHPYAPLGGCYDDPILGIVGASILEEGFLVATFNFRGAGESQGRTSWSSKPERNDYLSVLGFLVYYLHHLHVPSLTELRKQPARNSQHNIFSNQNLDSRLIVIGGYSYGGLVTASLPPITKSLIHSLFRLPNVPGSPKSEIRLRAKTLATQQNEVIQEHFLSLLSPQTPPRSSGLGGENEHIPEFDYESGSNSPTRKVSGSVRIGGEEDLHRSKNNHRGSLEKSSFPKETPERIRRSIDRVRSLTKHTRSGSRKIELSSESPLSSPEKRKHGSQRLPEESEAEKEKQTHKEEEEEDADVDGLGNLNEEHLQTAYLLISPPQGITGSFLTMWNSRAIKFPSLVSKSKDLGLAPEDKKLISNPTLVLFGNDDGFSSVKKYRQWAESLAKASMGNGENQIAHTGEPDATRVQPTNRFSYVEVNGAGHFWHNMEALGILRREVRDFVRKL